MLTSSLVLPYWHLEWWCWPRLYYWSRQHLLYHNVLDKLNDDASRSVGTAHVPRIVRCLAAFAYTVTDSPCCWPRTLHHSPRQHFVLPHSVLHHDVLAAMLFLCRDLLRVFHSYFLQDQGLKFLSLLRWSYNGLRPTAKRSMMMIAFITINSGLALLIEGLCAQILYFRFDIIRALRSHLLLFFFERKCICRRIYPSLPWKECSLALCPRPWCPLSCVHSPRSWAQGHCRTIAIDWGLQPNCLHL